MSKGRFGQHGGQFIPETLMNAVNELETAYEACCKDENISRRVKIPARNLYGKTFSALLRTENDKRFGRCKNLFKTGRF